MKTTGEARVLKNERSGNEKTEGQRTRDTLTYEGSSGSG